MAPRHGKNTTVLLGSVNLSSYLDSMDLSVDAERTDTSTFGTSWRTSLASFVEGKVDFSGYYDPTATTLGSAVTFVADARSTITARTPSKAVPLAAQSRLEPVPYSLPPITTSAVPSALCFIAAS